MHFLYESTIEYWYMLEVRVGIALSIVIICYEEVSSTRTINIWVLEWFVVSDIEADRIDQTLFVELKNSSFVLSVLDEFQLLVLIRDRIGVCCRLDLQIHLRVVFENKVL